jgi:C-terminal processing protease CtpA/Prc
MGETNMSKRKKRVQDIIAVILLFIIIAGVLYSSRYIIKRIFYSKFPPEAATSIGLTEEQKLEDFRYVYDTMTQSMPMIDEYQEVYGFSFRERKDQYEELIRSTESDLEFYAVMKSIVREVPSFHTDIVDVDGVQGPYCYNSEKVSSDRTVIANNKYLENEIYEAIDNNPDIKYDVFRYVDGAYYFDTVNSNDDVCNSYSKITEINGISVDEYVVNTPMIFWLFYDGVNGKPARTRIVFNSQMGTAVTLTVENQDGSTESVETHISALAEILWIYTDINDSSSDEDFLVYEDDENQISYVQLNSMGDTDGDEVYEALKNLKYENVILDLRNNYGGNVSYAADYIYPALFADDIEETSTWYMPDTSENESIIKNPYNYILIKPKKTTEAPYDSADTYYSSKVTYKYKGKQKQNKNVTILTQMNTGSAADRFVSDMKKNNMVTVIGNNTGGEGLANSYNMVSLPNSKVLLVYMPGGAKNPDGTDNSLYGTAPDYYVTQSIEDYYGECENVADETFDYSENYTYDTELRFAVDVMLGK